MREREKKKHRVSCNETGQTFSPVSHQELKLPLKKKWTNTNAEYINKCCINGKGITSFLWLHAEQVFNIGDITCRPLIFFFSSPPIFRCSRHHCPSQAVHYLSGGTRQSTAWHKNRINSNGELHSNEIFHRQNRSLRRWATVNVWRATWNQKTDGTRWKKLAVRVCPCTRNGETTPHAMNSRGQSRNLAALPIRFVSSLPKKSVKYLSCSSSKFVPPFLRSSIVLCRHAESAMWRSWVGINARQRPDLKHPIHNPSSFCRP